MSDCVTTGLSVFQPGQGEWTSTHVAHVYKSLGYGAEYQTIQDGLSMTPDQLIDMLIDDASASDLPVAPYWAEWTAVDYDNAGDDDLRFIHFQELQEMWISRGFTHPVQQKISIFWHDHFSTEEEVYGCNSYAWKYFYVLHEHALGNFRTFVQSMGLTEAMLVYLDGNQNVVGGPNENYARELMELFTMGEGNGYTQSDIENVARALTGYRVDMYECTPRYFDPSLYDDGVKTIFGQTGNFDYDDVHELIFTLRQQQVAEYMCEKLYTYFIYRVPDKEIIAGLAQTFINSNWEIVPVLKQLFKSEHFFDTLHIGSKIKSPIDLCVSLLSNLGLEIGVDTIEDLPSYIRYIGGEVGQDLFNPPNVAGWPAGRFWLSENALAYRWSFSHVLLNNYIIPDSRGKLQDMALLISESENDPVEIATSITQHIMGREIDSDLVDVAILYLKAGIPENYFEDGSWNLYWDEAPDQLLNMIKYLVQLPEYQLS